MELQHINVKIHVEGDLPVDPADFIPVFHQWVKDQVMDELLIDVADYRHVPAGPGVLLVGHEADYEMGNTDNRWGLRYSRKAPLGGTNEDRFRQAFRSAAHACGMLEKEFAGSALTFSRREFEFVVNDRALAPNTPATFEACKPELESFLRSLLGHDEFALVHRDDPRSLFGVIISSAQPFALTG